VQRSTEIDFEAHRQMRDHLAVRKRLGPREWGTARRRPRADL